MVDEDKVVKILEDFWPRHVEFIGTDNVKLLVQDGSPIKDPLIDHSSKFQLIVVYEILKTAIEIIKNGLSIAKGVKDISSRESLKSYVEKRLIDMMDKDELIRAAGDVSWDAFLDRIAQER